MIQPLIAHLTVMQPDWAPWLNALVLLWALMLGHAIADFPMQGEFLAIGKNRHGNLSAVTGGHQWPASIWIYCLTIHSMVQAAAVWLVTGSVILSVVEFVLHWLIDLAKNEKLTGFYSDQALHFVCKVAYASLVLFGISLF